MTITVPAQFAADLAEEAGDAGRRWLATLPELAAEFLARWDLTVDGETMHGAGGIVVPVSRGDGTPAVLKLTWPHDEAEHEALALSTWDGAGAVRLLAHDPAAWALLLERLDPHTSLLDVPIITAIDVLAGLIRRLDTVAPPQVRTLRDTAARWMRELPEENDDEGRPVPDAWLDRAVGYCAELGPVAGNHLVNEDLHYANVLRGEREPWLLIDPKPIAGDLEFGLIPLLWNRFDESAVSRRLAEVVELAGLDAEPARRWTFVRAVDNWLYCGEDTDLGRACARIAAAMLGNQ